MADAVAAAYNQTLIKTLTGFKYIGEQIKLFEQNGEHSYQFGFEESYGCLVGTHARDKDAVVAVMALCEAAAYYRTQGKTLWDQMLTIFDTYGYYKEDLYTITLKGIEGTQKIQEIMDNLRKQTPEQIGSYKVLEFYDYKEDVKKDMVTGEVGKSGLPKSNVLYFALENDTWCCARPSGTEPKLKFYMGVKGSSMQDAIGQLEDLTAAVKEMAGV